MSTVSKFDFQANAAKSLAKLIKSNPKEVTEVATQFLELGIDPNTSVKDYDLRHQKETSPVREAAKINNPSVTKLLLKFGAFPCAQADNSAIVTAAKRGHWDIVLLYKDKLTQTPNPQFRDILGHALLHAAKDSSDKAVEAAAMLLQAGANVDFFYDKYVVDLNGGAKCEVIGKRYRDTEEHDYAALPTPLHLAMHKGNARMIELLIANGANPVPEKEIPTLSGRYYTPAQMAERNKDYLSVAVMFKAVKLKDETPAAGLQMA